MNPQTQPNDIPTKLSKSSIEAQLGRQITEEYYTLLLKESLIHLLETKEDEEYE